MAKSVSKAKQMKIAKYYLKNPSKTSYAKVALKFGVSVDQVRNYVKKFRSEKYIAKIDEEVSKEIKEERIRVNDELEEYGQAALMKEIILDTIAELRVRKDLPIKERIKMTNDITLAKSRNQKLELVDALKKPDAKKVIKLCKLIDPSLTESKIINLWKQIEIED